MRRLILASASPRRAELLKQIGLEFTIMAGDLREDVFLSNSPGQLVTALALKKAELVAQTTKEGLVIGADTVVVFGERILGKPSGPDEAVRMLKLLNGREHSVYTGIALVEVPGGKSVTSFEETRVNFRMLSEAEIEAYVATGEPLDKAGAYGIQGKGAVLVERINGCYFNVVGLPVQKLVIMLQEFGISLWGTKL